MNRKFAILTCIICVMFTTCEHVFDPEQNKLDGIYLVQIKPTENGSVTVIPDSGTVGTEIKVIVNPAPGYKLEPDSLQTLIIGSDREKATVGLIRDYDMRFQMMTGGVSIFAKFIPLAANEYSVSVTETPHGHLSAYPVTGKMGDQIQIEVLPDAGYALKDGTLKANGVDISGPPYKFQITGSNVTLTAEFEKKGSAELASIAAKTLTSGEYDLAFAYYEAAYQADPNNAEAIIYSVLGKIASIIKNPKVRVLLKETGMSRVPSNINELMDFENTGARGWVKEYYDYYNYPDSGTGSANPDAKIILPALASPQGFPMGFLNYPIFQVLNSRRLGSDRELFDVLLFWNIVGNHPEGLNDFFDDLIKYTFGNEFNEAVARTARLQPNQTAPFNSTLRIALKLDSVYGAESVIGKAELEALTGAMYAAKAMLEVLASYDWETDLSVIKIMVNYQDKINNIINSVLSNTIKDQLNNSSDFSPLGKILPLRNHFLRERNASLMNVAKSDFRQAVELLESACDTCYTRFLPEAKIKYKWIQGAQGCISLLYSAMINGENFYLPEIPKYKSLAYAMEGKTEWVSAADAKYGINLDKFFVPGYLSAEKMVTTEMAGKAPVFFGFKNSDNSRTAITQSETNLNQYDSFGFELGLNFKNVFVKVNGINTADARWLSDLFSDTELTKSNGMQLYELYQKR